MRAARSLVMAAAGAAGAAAVLAASPETYNRLRRRLGLIEGREHFETALPDGERDGQPSEPAGAELRLSLRARLAQDLEVEQATAAAEPVAAATMTARPARDRAATREQLRGARERLEAKAAAAAAALDAPGDPNVLEDDTADLPLHQDADASRTSG